MSSKRGDVACRIFDGLAQPPMLGIVVSPGVPVHPVGVSGDLFWGHHQASFCEVGVGVCEPARHGDEKRCRLDHLHGHGEVGHGDGTLAAFPNGSQGEFGNGLPAVQDVDADVVLGQVLFERQSIGEGAVFGGQTDEFVFKQRFGMKMLGRRAHLCVEYEVEAVAVQLGESIIGPGLEEK